MSAAPGIRSVTAEEVEHFRDHGWVKLKGLISPELASRLRQSAAELISQHPADREYGWWIDQYDLVDQDEGYRAFALGPEMGLNAQHLMQRNVGIRLYSNLVAVKAGSTQASTSGPSLWHQDGTDTPIDRASWVRFWVALDHVTPDMGSINFIDRSHSMGLLGDTHLKEPEPNRVLFEKYPELSTLGEVGPLAFEAGDATVHTLYTVHGAPSNTTPDPRWAFIATYVSDDAHFTAATDRGYGFQKAKRAGLVRGDHFHGDLYPHVCGPKTASY